MRKLIILVFCLFYCFLGQLNAQHEYIGITAYKDDVLYLLKVKGNDTTANLLSRLTDICSKSTRELETFGLDNPELQQLQTDIRDYLKPRPSVYGNSEIERTVIDYLLSHGDILYIDCVNLQNDDWQLSPRGTYKFFEFDAVGKNVLNRYVLINGYYKVELQGKSRHVDSRGKNIPYVYVEYKRAITYHNYVHRLIRR